MMIIRGKEKHPNGKIYENKFGYQTKSEVYMNKSSDIKELCAIAITTRKKIRRIHNGPVSN